MIDLNSLYVFWLACKLGSISAAARTLKISQSAATQRLRALEGRFGMQLYERAGNRFTPIARGHTLLDACANTFTTLDALAAPEFSDPRLPTRTARRTVDAVVLGKGAVLFPRAAAHAAGRRRRVEQN